MVADLHYLHQEQQTNNNNNKNISKTEGRTDEQQQQLFETASAKSIQTKTLSKARTQNHCYIQQLPQMKKQSDLCAHISNLIAKLY